VPVCDALSGRRRAVSDRPTNARDGSRRSPFGLLVEYRFERRLIIMLHAEAIFAGGPSEANLKS